MSNENYEKVLKQCKEYIKTEFKPCGLKDDVERRIFELVQTARVYDCMRH